MPAAIGPPAHPQRSILMRKFPFVLIASLVGALTLAACDNTIRGVGRDVKESGNAVEDVVE